MRLLKPLLWGLLASALLFTGAARAEKRVALVIGNSAYAKVSPLPNPANDAAAVATLLRSSGFDVVESRSNLRGAEMRRVIRDFSDQTRDAEIALVYFAGHGIEVDGTNYLLPTDATLERDIDIEDEAVSLDRIVKILEPARRLRIVILDACRDNPFVRSMRRDTASRSVGRGLARIEPASSDTLIAFAAKAGSVAADGDGSHSPFTTALLNNIATPGLDLRIAFGRVRDEVLRLTGNRQEPFVYGSLGGTTVALVPEAKAQPKLAAPAPTPTSPATADPDARMRADYEFAAQLNTVQAWAAFLATYPNGFYAELARSHQARLAATAVPPPQAQPDNRPIAVAPPPEPATPPKQVIAALPPSAPPSPAADESDTARQIHRELIRLGCYAGSANSAWGTPSRRALESFNKKAKLHVDVEMASLDTLMILRERPDNLCAPPREPRKEPAPRQERARAKEPARQATTSSGGTEHIACGQTGCFEVKKGCTSEQRPSGNSFVAVVTCSH